MTMEQALNIIMGSGGALALCLVFGYFAYRHLNGQIRFWKSQAKEERDERRKIHTEVSECQAKLASTMDTILEIVTKIDIQTNGKVEKFKNDVVKEVLKNREAILKNKHG